MRDATIEIVIFVPPEALDRTPDWRDDERLDLLLNISRELFRGHDVDLGAGRRDHC